MDNNFVNIDDLVRQRLGGGEEQERSGAWLHMRELLDEEMPRQAGFVYWRRMLSASAVLLLIASISVGGYELSASRNGNTPGNDAVATKAIPNASGTINEAKSTAPIAMASGVAQPNNETTKNNITSSGTIANNNIAKTNSQDKLPAGQPGENRTAANNHLITKQNHKQPVATEQKVSTHKSDATIQNNDYSPLAANNVAGKENSPVAAGAPATKSAGSSEADKNVKTTALAVVGTVNENKVNTDAAGNPDQMSLVGKQLNDDKPVVASSGLANKTTGATSGTAGKVKMKELALASHPLSVSHPKVAAAAILPRVSGTTGNGLPGNTAAHASVAAVGTSKIAGNKLPLSSHAVANKKKNIVANAVKVDPAKVLAVKNEKKIVSSKTLAAASSAAKAPKPVSGNLNKTVKPNIAGNSAVENVAKDAPTAIGVSNERKEKKVMQKLVLYEQEHYIKTDPGNGYFNLDTISMKTINEELAASGENNAAPVAEKMSAERKTVTAANSTTANNSAAARVAANGGNSNGSTSATTDPGILAGASASANGKPAMGQKATSASATSTGAGALGSLESAFNDVKYNVKGVQFAAGLTAGINGTFFGPSSFNGFQFGVTGDFAFSNEWSFASELKYFQRANNNYSLNDNYTTYSANPGGGYTMTQTTNAYNFTALHSIEMPLIVRYTNGKFNFFVGGNLVYSFAINEGYAQSYTTSTTSVNGNDTNPKINSTDPQADFNSRFGVGCLFGIAYKIAPNFNVDLRNVMTLWDNSNSPGAKYISDQVYKSPSLQLSVGYRLGSNKHKE